MRTFTEQEQKVLTLTAELWNAISDLPPSHPDEKNEARLYIHQLQGLMACRLAFEPKLKPHK